MSALALDASAATRARDTTADDTAPLWSAAPWQPHGATAKERDASLFEFARALRAPSQVRSRRLDRELAHPTLPAGYTYFGQLVAHDVSHHEPPGRPPHASTAPIGAGSLVNRRREKLVLETLYGGGPGLERELYEHDDAARMRVVERRSPEKGRRFFDLARAADGRALVADHRQDQNAIVAQVHVALARAHNALVGALRELEPTVAPLEIHARARAWLVRCYRHVLVHDWLPRVLDERGRRDVEAALATARSGARLELPLFGGAAPFVSAEFAFAALRFGHALVREQYRMRPEGYLYDMTAASEEPDWLERGGPFLMLSRPLPPIFAVDWRAFVENEDVEPNRARRIGPRVAWALGNLPRTASEPPWRALLPYLTLRAGCARGLVSGASAARALGLAPLAGDDEPLWSYVLREAEVQCAGLTLGELGSAIVGQTLIGLALASDGALARAPDRIPPLGAHEDRFVLLDLLTLGDRDAPWISERVSAEPASPL